MAAENRINQIGFPDTLEQGYEVAIGSRIEAYMQTHPQATSAEAYKACLPTAKSAIPLRIDAVVGGVSRPLNVIATLPSDEQIALGNHALELEFMESVAFGNPLISSWVEDCSEELFDAVYAFGKSQI